MIREEYDYWYYQQDPETIDRFPETRLPPRVEGFEYNVPVARAFTQEPDDSEVYAFLPDDLKPADNVMHPAHYSQWAMEPIEFIAINNLPWWMANVIKYVMRFEKKDGLQDLYKARSYLEMKIRQLEGDKRFWDKPVNVERTLNDVSKKAA